MSYKSQVSDFMGTVAAVVDIITDAVAENTKNAGSALENEIRLRKKNAERAKLIYELGEAAFTTKTIDDEIIRKIQEIENEIADLKKDREA